MVRSSSARALACAAAVLFPTVGALMYDVIEPHKVTPAKCTNGCKPWTNESSLYWADPANQQAAQNFCAQPGNAVNDHPFGSWCACADGSDANAATDPDHPFANQTVAIYNTYDGEDLFASFAYTAAPPGEAASQNWIRITYPDQKDAMYVEFQPIAGEKDTYVMYNSWKGYEGWVGYDLGSQQNEPFLRANFKAASQALKVKLVPATLPTEYLMIDVDATETNSATTYVSFCTGSCSNGKWMKSGYTDLSDAMSFKLIPGGDADNWDYCTSAKGVPEQINVQIAEPGSVVVSFVTFEAKAPTEPPVVTVSGKAIEGVTHVHTTAGGRIYYMHFVRLSNLQPSTSYTYNVRSGGSGAATSPDYTFLSGPKLGGETKVNIYGDMGVYTWNNMGNVFADCHSGAADLIVHLGDHAYNEGEGDEVRGDGYMSAWQKALTNCSWMPVVGNHEFYDGAELGRFLNQTWEGWGPIAGGDVPSSSAKQQQQQQRKRSLEGRSTATSPLGALLSTGNFHALARPHTEEEEGEPTDTSTQYRGGGHPSNTSRYFSVDYGLIHFVALDLNVYYGVDTCGDACRQSQLEWLKEDLALVNAHGRDSTPWVVVMSHFPFYCTGCYAKQSAMWYASNGAEFHGNANATAEAIAKECALNNPNLTEAELKAWQQPITQGSDASIADLVPILQNFSVDLYIAGHWHYYESLFPATPGKTGTGGDPLQKDFVNPNVTVHITTGNGGPPSADSFHEDCPGPDCNSIPSTRAQSVAYGYGRLVVHNATHIEFSQYRNNDSALVDSFVVEQQNHGSFPPMDSF